MNIRIKRQQLICQTVAIQFYSDFVTIRLLLDCSLMQNIFNELKKKKKNGAYRKNVVLTVESVYGCGGVLGNSQGQFFQTTTEGFPLFFRLLD